MFIQDPDFYPARILDPGSRIPDPGSRIPDPGSRFPDPKTATKERGEKKICCHTIFCSHKFHKIENYFIFEMLKKIIWANFQRILQLFTQKISSQKYGFGIQDPEKTYSGSGSRGQKGIGSWIPDLDPQHCYSDIKKNWIRQMITNQLTTMTLFISLNLKRVTSLTHFYHLNTDKKKNIKFPHILGNSDGIRCKVIYEVRLPNIWAFPHILVSPSSYIVKYLSIASNITNPFLIYDFATDPIWIALYMKKIFFSFFLSVHRPGRKVTYALPAGSRPPPSGRPD
jgi:hypothetical protein